MILSKKKHADVYNLTYLQGYSKKKLIIFHLRVLPDMIEEFEHKVRRRESSFRSLRDYGMGIIWIILGLAFVFRKQLGVGVDRYPPDYTDIILGVLFMLYGSWRVYRGYKKKYFR